MASRQLSVTDVLVLSVTDVFVPRQKQQALASRRNMSLRRPPEIQLR
tara:strand:+ start:1230 stop:1370 length:141 start_codon:yes stop_codon:yes gene_type:complete